MLRRRFVLTLAAALVGASAACDDGPTAVSNGIVTVRREGEGIRLTNQTAEARGYLAIDQDFMALADLSLIALCATADSACLRLPPNGSVLEPFSDVMGYNASTKKIIVWTWRVLPTGPGGQLQAVTDASLVLTL